MNNRSLRLPAGFDQFAERPRLFQNRDLPRNGIFRAVHPAIVMVPANHPFVGKRRARNFSDHIVERLDVPIRFHFQVHFCRPRPHMISNPQTASPILWSHAPLQRREQRLRVRVRNRQHRNLRNRRRFLHFQSLRVFGRAHSRRQRVARIKRHVRDAAALHTIERPIRSARKRLSFDKTILMRIGINQAPHGAVLRGNLRLDAAPGMKIARDDNLPLH